MPVATDYFSAVYSKLVAILRTRLTLIGVNSLVKPANFTEYSSQLPYPNMPPRPTPDAYPMIKLTQGDGGDPFFYDSATFAMESSTFVPSTGEWSEIPEQQYKFLIVGQDERIAPVNQIKSEIAAAIRNAGPSLGLPYAKLIKATYKHDLTSRPLECAGMSRQVCEIKLTVQMIHEGATELL